MLRVTPTDKEILSQLFADVLGPTRFVKLSVDAQLQRAVREIDEVALFCKYKFGVLFCRKGQTREEEMFGNGTSRCCSWDE